MKLTRSVGCETQKHLSYIIIILSIVIVIVHTEVFQLYRHLRKFCWIHQWLFEGAFHSDSPDAIEEVAFSTKKTLLIKPAALTRSLGKPSVTPVQAKKLVTEGFDYQSLSLLHRTCGKGRLSWGPKEEGGQELAARREVVQGTQFTIEVRRAVRRLFHSLCLFFPNRLFLEPLNNKGFHRRQRYARIP